MSTQAVELRLPVPDRVGQATAVEQSRAAAEVAAAVMVAQQNPRSESRAQIAMRESCKQPGLAERAFYRYPRGGAQITGASVHLARELARCWGNVQFGINELRRDDLAHQSEMQAWAWDLQGNVRVSNTFIVPHMRDRSARGKGKADAERGPELLVDLRDVYENNANMGARRLREAIFAVLPPWFTEEAKTKCYETLEHGGGEPLPTRRTNAIERFATDLSVTRDQLEQRLGRSADDWTAADLAQLHVIMTSVKRGETTKAEEFPPPAVTAAEIAGQTATAPTGPAEPVSAAEQAEPARQDDASRPTPPATALDPAAVTERPERPLRRQPAEDWPATAQPPDSGQPGLDEANRAEP